MFTKLMHCRCGKSWSGASLLILRLALGLTFLFHGWQKMGMGNAGVAGFLDGVGIPAATFFAFVVTYVELLGGIALILGVLTHWAAKLLAIDMIVAIVAVHLSKLGAGLPDGFLSSSGGPELALLAFAGLLVLMVMGPGAWALKRGHCGDGCCEDGSCESCCKNGVCASGVCKPEMKK